MRGRTNQGGWIVNFAVVGMLLVLGLITTAYILKSYHGDAGELANKDPEASKQQGASDDEDKTSKPDESKKDTNGDTADPTKTDNKPDEQPATDAQEDADTPPVESSPEEKTDNEAEALPATGPSDLFAGTIALGALTYSTVLYRRSRQ